MPYLTLSKSGFNKTRPRAKIRELEKDAAEARKMKIKLDSDLPRGRKSKRRLRLFSNAALLGQLEICKMLIGYIENVSDILVFFLRKSEGQNRNDQIVCTFEIAS